MELISPECCLREVARKQKSKGKQVDKESSLSSCPWHTCITAHATLL